MFGRRRLTGAALATDGSTDVLGVIALAAAARLAAWAVVPGDRFASDEDSYFAAATALLERGEQDLFWPPLTGWLIALARRMLSTDWPGAIRLVWILMDLGCVALVWALARRTAQSVAPVAGAARRVALLASMGWALYLPAVSHAQFLTSETPALLVALLALAAIARSGATTPRYAFGGAAAGLLCLARPSVLPLLGAWPIAASWPLSTQQSRRRAIVFVATGVVLVGGVLARNWQRTGRLVLADNAAYNFHIGNRDFYAEDLDLLHPAATPAQIEFRRAMRAGELADPEGSPSELVSAGVEWIRAHPGTFARRAAGRLARVFVPRTDVIELAGGEARTSVFHPFSIALLAVANLQWLVVLGGGLVGLAAIRRLAPDLGRVYAATIAGALLLCLVAISKPRYSFVFDPLLVIGAACLVAHPRAIGSPLTRGDRAWLAAAGVFLAWAWAAWAIFAWTSRAAS